MTASCVLPEFNIDEATDIARDVFDIGGQLRRLNGERDLNYLVTTEHGRFVFKIANREESYGLLECQHQVLERLVADNVMPRQVSSIASRQGRVIETITSRAGIDHYCRILPYLEGRLLCEETPLTPELLDDFGQKLARIDNSLQDFDHEALHRQFIWNMPDAPATLERFKPMLESNQNRELVEYFETLFRENVMSSGVNLRRSVIHNDANDNNVLVDRDDSGELTISSIIDFGDMVYSWLAAEPAVAAAYVMMASEDPLDVAATIIRGYHQALPLHESEIGVFFELICMRLCMSVCNCAYQKSLEPDNEYLRISEKPAWALLDQLSSVSTASARQLFHAACGMKS